MRQLTLFSDVESEPKSSSLTNVSEPKKPTHQHFQKNTKPYINTYSPGGQDSIYYRFSYREGKKVKHTLAIAVIQ